ncbi:MAG: NAD-dependent epimerase/dehydratase family protein [Sphingomonadales bacterium]|nr:NAD-dependent epimerase/dehydratase family protein [Sphingomonadales bacterium]
MKIIITGASGHIGRALVPYLLEQGHELLLAGRNAGTLETMFPGKNCCNYHELSDAAKGYQACVHLAVMNNSEAGDLAAFRTANLSGLKHIYEDVRQAGVTHFINLTSFHAADPKQKSPYAISKREADHWLSEQQSMNISQLRLPAVYSAEAGGNLAKVNRLPAIVQKPALWLLGALKPIADRDLVVRTIGDLLNKGEKTAISIANPADRNPFFILFKKLTDYGFALSVLILTWWLMLILFAAVKLSSAGPAIFAQQRVGRYGKPFTCYKFRTMRTGTKQAGTHDIGADAITGIGAFLRRTKLDELPQLVNILRGEISLVGPRPCLPVQEELVAERRVRGVLNILPGITGWAQINDIDMSDPVRLAVTDADYSARRSIPFELLIILKTFTGSGQGDRTAG